MKKKKSFVRTLLLGTENVMSSLCPSRSANVLFLYYSYFVIIN